MPIAYIALIDAERQWFKAKCGLTTDETGRDISFCGHAILQDQALVVPDATLDDRFKDNPLVTGEPYVRFYAGHPLTGPHGHNVGTFCIADRTPRTLDDGELEQFRRFAAIAEHELNMMDLIEAQHELIDTKNKLVQMQQRLTDELAGLDEIVFEHAAGVRDGRKLKGVIPGGVSMPILPAGQLDVPMANEFLRERKTMLGTGGIIVMDETTCMVRVASVISYFFRDESCGQCTQCREGTGWINKIVERIERGAGVREDLDLLLDLAGKMEGQTICAFADAAAWPVQGLLRHFRDDFEAHVELRKCPFPESFEL